MTAEPDGGPDWLDALRDLAPVEPADPWGDQADRTGVHLSDDQRAFLSALADMPDVPRLQDVDDVAAINEVADEIVDPDGLLG